MFCVNIFDIVGTRNEQSYHSILSTISDKHAKYSFSTLWVKNGLSFSSQSEVSLFAVAKSLSKTLFPKSSMLNAGQSKFLLTRRIQVRWLSEMALYAKSLLEGRCYHPL